jgi:hypothetical protein
MLWSEDHVWITFSKTQWEKYEKGFYIFLKTLVYDIEYVLNTTLKTVVEKLGDMRYVLVLILPH